MNILITGASGQLGRDCMHVMQDDHNIHGNTSRQLDITSLKKVQQEVAVVHPDLIINCAAYTAVDNCEKEQDRCRSVNEQGAANLAEVCAAAGCRLIHISTDYVFDGNKPVPEAYTEQDPVSPLSAYGRSKLAGEQAIEAAMDDFLILRTAWLYGMGGNNFLKTMLRLSVADPKRTIRVVNDQYGSLTWTMTLAHQIKKVLASGLTGIVHATADNYSTWFAGANYFLQTMKVDFSLEPCTTEEYPAPAHRPTNSILANNRLKEHGLHVMQNWQQ
ncbi:MAG: dTDP-4-dehydrorhamnose reductase, partial [Thermodesulfobacteriota bacterium]|nr:dTDP-4-dehydrorhamnose reductase [Thermodesulfobacteriota bacterium]